MGYIEFAVLSISTIVNKKYKDEKLASDIMKIASECGIGNAIMSGDEGASPNQKNNKAIIEITDRWKKEYSNYLP